MTSLDPKNTIDFSISDFTEYSYVLDGVSEAYSTELPESYRHCVAGCTQMNYRGDRCTVTLVLYDNLFFFFFFSTLCCYIYCYQSTSLYQQYQIHVHQYDSSVSL